MPMPFLRCATILLLISATVLLTGARNPQTKRKAAPANPGAHSAAVRFLDEALVRLDADHVKWLDTRLWQKGRLGRYDFEAEGRYLVGTDNRFRLEITTRYGRAASTTLTVSDGLTIKQGNRASAGEWSDLLRVNVNRVIQSPQPGARPILSSEIQQDPSLAAVVPVLRSLRSGTHWSRIEHVRRGSRALIKLTGTWSEQARTINNPPNQAWPAPLQRRCRLYLDPASFWPYRIEFWGPEALNKPDSLFLQMEFRDPVINKPMTEELCAREFSFPVEANQKFDQSEDAIQRIRKLLAPPAADR